MLKHKITSVLCIIFGLFGASSGTTDVTPNKENGDLFSTGKISYISSSGAVESEAKLKSRLRHEVLSMLNSHQTESNGAHFGIDVDYGKPSYIKDEENDQTFMAPGSRFNLSGNKNYMKSESKAKVSGSATNINASKGVRYVNTKDVLELTCLILLIVGMACIIVGLAEMAMLCCRRCIRCLFFTQSDAQKPILNHQKILTLPPNPLSPPLSPPTSPPLSRQGMSNALEHIRRSSPIEMTPHDLDMWRLEE